MLSMLFKLNLLKFLLIVISTSPSAAQNAVTLDSTLSSFTGPVTRVISVVGGEASLPCDSRPPQSDDSLFLVVWYRDSNPIYSYDKRFSGASGHWSDNTFGNRARWVGFPNSSLHVQNVRSDDRSIYRCRVDFKESPTRNYFIDLDVIELPSEPIIFDEFGEEIIGTAGPFNEGDDFKLICSVNGGNPTPRVQWLHGENVLSLLCACEMPEENMRSLTLWVKNATRAHLSSAYTCTADNTLLSPPKRASVHVDLYLRPLSVEILSREQPLSVGRQNELWCKSTGARPPAVVTWWLGGKKLESITKQQDLRERNETQSLLKWTPSKEQNGKILTCRAEHSKFNSSTIESKLQLNIHYVPFATIHLGAKMNPNDIEEGDDVYFGCEIDANPLAYKVVWEHNGILLQHNPANGLIITGNTNLALRNVSRHQAGNYTCTASNVQGDGKSLPVQMQVVYRPICRTKDMKIIGAALQELSKVECEVDAFPPPDTFEWTLNNSASSIKVDPERFNISRQEGKSVLTYVPVSDTGYGKLSCRATNLAGQQMLPCVYIILPTTRPDPLFNCSIFNLTDDSLDLTCLAGYEGGLQCIYVAEVWANDNLVTNSTNVATFWNLRRLGAKRHLNIVVYAANTRGRSEHVTIKVETAPQLSTRTKAQEAWGVNWAVGGVLCAAVPVAFILCLALITSRLRYCAKDYEVTAQSPNNQNVTLQNRGSPEDRNSNLIPFSKDDPPEPLQYSAVVMEAKNPTSSQSFTHTQFPSSATNTQDDLANERPVHRNARSHRQIVTTRTLYLAALQESYV